MSGPDLERELEDMAQQAEPLIRHCGALFSKRHGDGVVFWAVAAFAHTMVMLGKRRDLADFLRGIELAYMLQEGLIQQRLTEQAKGQVPS